MTCIELSVRGQKLSTTWKARICQSSLSNKIQDTPTKTDWSWAQFQKGQPTSCKTV